MLPYRLYSRLVSDKLAHPLLNLTNNPVPGPSDDNTIYVGSNIAGLICLVDLNATFYTDLIA